MFDLFVLPSGPVLKNTLGDIVDSNKVELFTEYGGSIFSKKYLRDRLRLSFGKDTGDSLLSQILELSRKISMGVIRESPFFKKLVSFLPLILNGIL